MSSSSSSSSSEGNSSSSSSSSEEYSSESSSSEEFSSSSTSSEGDSSSSSTSYEDPITKTLLLDGTKYITMGDVYDYNSPSKKFGFAGWIKAANTTGNHCIVSKFVSNTGYKALIDDGKIALHIYKDASNKQIHASDNVVISANVWTHITFGHTDTNITGNVYDSTLYINGIEENMGGAWTGDVDTFTSVANLEIGRSGDNDEFFEGNITNLVWFDNYTPTQADATNLFNSGEFLYPSTVTSVYVNVDNYWALDDRDISELNTITDIKGVYDGTAVNITLTDFEEDIP
jgi:hypothetical protein